MITNFNSTSTNKSATILNNFSPRFSVGYAFNNNFRVALDGMPSSFTFYEFKFKKDESQSSEKSQSSIGKKIISDKRYSIGISAMYDFQASPKIKPYTGIRLSLLHSSSYADEKVLKEKEVEEELISKIGKELKNKLESGKELKNAVRETLENTTEDIYQKIKKEITIDPNKVKKELSIGGGAIFGIGFHINENVVWDINTRINYWKGNTISVEGSTGLRVTF